MPAFLSALAFISDMDFGKRHRRLAGIALTLVALAGPISFTRAASTDDTTAVLSYQKLDDFFQGSAAIDQQKLSVQMFVCSTNRALQASNLTLTVRARRGSLPLTITTNGQIVVFPHEKDLVAENPPVVSNQPKGSLYLFVKIFIPLHDARTFSCSRLADGVLELNKLIKTQAGMLSPLAPKGKSVTFYFRKKDAGKATVSIVSPRGTKVLTADTNGLVRLTLEPSLIAENPEIHLSESALVAPDMP